MYGKNTPVKNGDQKVDHRSTFFVGSIFFNPAPPLNFLWAHVRLNSRRGESPDGKNRPESFPDGPDDRLPVRYVLLPDDT